MALVGGSLYLSVALFTNTLTHICFARDFVEDKEIRSQAFTNAFKCCQPLVFVALLLFHCFFALVCTMADTTDDNRQTEQRNSDSESSSIFDFEEVDATKLDLSNGGDQLQFVDSYYQSEQASSLLTDTTDSFSNEENNLDVLPWDRLAEWIHCFCVVTFDLEIGQMIEVQLLLLLLSILVQFFFHRLSTLAIPRSQNRIKQVYVT